MLIAIDIGNTSLDFAVLKGQRVIKRYQTATVAAADVLRKNLKKIFFRLKRQYGNSEAVIVCSVVPEVLKFLEPLLKQTFPQKVYVLGRDIVVPIVNRYANPRQVGQDRLVCAYAAAHLYGYPTVIIDLGTAITFDVVSAKREYLGGMIVPGIKLSADTLFQKTALLPLVKIRQPRSLIGKDTQSSILSGIFYGYGMMMQGVVSLVGQRMPVKPKAVVTGGYADLMKKFISAKIDIIDRNLVLKGMALVWKIRKRGRHPSYCSSRRESNPF